MLSRLSLPVYVIYLVAVLHLYLDTALCAPTTGPARPLDVSLGPLAIQEDELAAEKGAWLYTSLAEYKDDLLTETLPGPSGTVTSSDTELNFLAKTAYNEYQDYLGKVSTKYGVQWSSADSYHRSAVMVILAIRNPKKDSQTKTLLFIASSAKGNNLMYGRAPNIPDPVPQLWEFITSCETKDKTQHRSGASCGEPNALSLFFQWAQREGLKPDDTVSALKGAKSIAWWRPVVMPRANKNQKKIQQQKYDALPQGEYKDPCSKNDGGRPGFGCDELLSKAGIITVPMVQEDLFGGSTLGDKIIATQAVSVLPSPACGPTRRGKRRSFDEDKAVGNAVERESVI
ncbi:MAG: hypothetical protein Q9157_003348 [Trypethelium eluteriae]